MPNGEAYLKGARLFDYVDADPVYWSNTSNCMYAIVSNVWLDFPFTANFFMNETITPWPKWQNSTLFLHEVSDSLYTCNDMLKNMHGYLAQRINLFQYSLLIWSYSFLQNVLAKILSVNNIYRSLMVAVNNDIEVIIYFDTARIIRTLFDFDPIEVENPDEDWYYNPNGTYSDANGYWQYQLVSSERPKMLNELDDQEIQQGIEKIIRNIGSWVKQNARYTIDWIYGSNN